MSRGLSVWVFVLLLALQIGCDGCREKAGALVGGDLPALPELTSWETHLRAFSLSAARPPKEALRYRSASACPLRYGFVWVRRSNASVKQEKKQPMKMSEMRLFGELRATGEGTRMTLAPLWLRVLRKLPGQKRFARASADSIFRFLQQGAVSLKSDGRSWELTASGKGGGVSHGLWNRVGADPVLSRFWPELPKAVVGHAKDVKKKIPGGSLRARSYTKHWLTLEGERLGVMMEQMQVKRPKVQLDQAATYAMLTRGHLLYAHIRHRSWVLDPGRGDGKRTETTIEGELRLLESCHKLKLAPFVTALTKAELAQRKRASR